MPVTFQMLEELRAHIGDCHRCPLGDTRTTLVFGTGDSGARVMLIGEAPGRSEDLRGEPFVGAAGRLLDELLASADLMRGDVYIANILKCRPPGNRNPQATEIDTCTPFLREQIRLVNPDVLVTLGNFASRFILETSETITRLRGTVRYSEGTTVLPIFHPAAALYDSSKRSVLFEDFGLVRRLLARTAVPADDRDLKATGPA